jgi:hypothetical protein
MTDRLVLSQTRRSGAAAIAFPHAQLLVGAAMFDRDEVPFLIVDAVQIPTRSRPERPRPQGPGRTRGLIPARIMAIRWSPGEEQAALVTDVPVPPERILGDQGIGESEGPRVRRKVS